MAGAVGGCLVCFPIATRMVFAWSFDRVIPTKISEVNSRGAPTYAVVLMAVAGFVFVLLALYTNFIALLLYTGMNYWLDIALVGLAAATLPFWRKSLFEGGTAGLRRRVGGVPLISILGILTIIAGVAVTYMSVSPAFSLTPFNPTAALIPLSIWVVAAVIYIASYAYHRSKQISLSLAFKEIPPE